MKKLLSREKGVTIITVTTMVIVILVIIAVFGFYARNSVKMESFQGMKADIKEIEAKALLYYVDYKALPITNVNDVKDHFSFGDEEFRNPNDSDKYFKVDLNKLGVTKAYDTDLHNGRLRWKARAPAGPDSSHLKPLPYHSKAYVHHTGNSCLVQL